LQEIMGAIIIGYTEFQKIFILLGSGRSGKGTILWVLEVLLGNGGPGVGGSVSPTFSDLIGRFGRWSMIGKKLTAITDLHVGRNDDLDKGVGILKQVS